MLKAFFLLVWLGSSAWPSTASKNEVEITYMTGVNNTGQFISARMNLTTADPSNVNITHVNVTAGLVRFDADYTGVGRTENSTVRYRITGFRPFSKQGGLPVYFWLPGA
eukprot:9269516-Pyramimonas_sp.AAC.1